MAFEQKPGQGTLFKNKKEKDSQPDYRGSVIADRDYREGDKIELASWVKTPAKGGEKFLSLSISKPRQGNPTPTHASASAPNDLDDEVPF